jgi:hypothetical protein
VSDQADSVPLRVEDLAETDSFTAWRVEEPDGEITYHIEFGSVTLHFFQEEWDEALALFRMLLG